MLAQAIVERRAVDPEGARGAGDVALVALDGGDDLVALLLLQAAPAPAGVADQIGATFGLMLQDVVDAFPPVEGLVVSVDGDRLYLDLTEKNGIQPGQEFTVFRKGDAFRHPVSGQPMGRFENVLGYAQVARLLPQFSEATFVPVPGKPSPQPRVRANSVAPSESSMPSIAMPGVCK